MKGGTGREKERREEGGEFTVERKRNEIRFSSFFFFFILKKKNDLIGETTDPAVLKYKMAGMVYTVLKE